MGNEGGGRRESFERLSAIDASFLYAERSGAHTHIGAVATLSGPAPSLAELRGHIGARLHLVPRYRQRLYAAGSPLGRPLWIDDVDFDLDYHVQRTTLPAGGEGGIERFAERVFSQRLDRSKPLWEIWLVDGLPGDRFAIVNKSHHALLDGIAGIGVAAAIFDTLPDTPPPSPPPAWNPSPEPSAADIASGV